MVLVLYTYPRAVLRQGLYAYPCIASQKMETIYQYSNRFSGLVYLAMDLRPCAVLDDTERKDMVAELRRKWRALALVVAKPPAGKDMATAASKLQWMLCAYDQTDTEFTTVKGCVLGWCPDKDDETLVQIHKVFVRDSPTSGGGGPSAGSSKGKGILAMDLVEQFQRALMARHEVDPLQMLVLPLTALSDPTWGVNLPWDRLGYEYRASEGVWLLASRGARTYRGDDAKRRSGSGSGGRRAFAYTVPALVPVGIYSCPIATRSNSRDPPRESTFHSRSNGSFSPWPARTP